MIVGLGLGGVPSCTSEDCSGVTRTGNPGNCEIIDPSDGNPIVEELAKQCGLDITCGQGIAEGNTAISGVQAVDSYFASVVRFKVEADALSSALEHELATLRATLGVTDLGPALRARIAADADGELRVQADAPSCEVSSEVVLAARQRCEGGLVASSESSELECYGRCELPPDGAVMCDGSAELACTRMAGASRCTGECKGRCTTDETLPAACGGICRGTCNGSCSLYSDSAGMECAGRCDGMCTGSCEIELLEGARCDGSCSGDCTVVSSNGSCEGARSASCQAAPNSFVLCSGRCEGEVGSGMGKVECEVTVRSEANMNLQCSLPRVSIDYQVRSELNLEERERFEFTMHALQQRLPVILRLLARAEGMANGGADLSAGANAVKAAAMASLSGDANLRVKFGVACAVREIGEVGVFVGRAGSRLSNAVDDALAMTTAVGLQ